DPASEVKTLRVARRLADIADVTVRTSFLGAHSVPPEWKADRAGYINLVAGEMLDAVAREGLADAVDAFMESIAFTADEVRRVFL
ncbi:hypothetical protein, partial [Parvimonas sp. M20]|uniref:hypothetical protein n=1 Tax=Parvimonas sp. M20 TaxID=3110693 RepID=UPI002D1DD4A3|nr:imidazolonepropionase [Parvimonas sp. M20]